MYLCKTLNNCIRLNAQIFANCALHFYMHVCYKLCQHTNCTMRHQNFDSGNLDEDVLKKHLMGKILAYKAMGDDVTLPVLYHHQNLTLHIEDIDARFNFFDYSKYMSYDLIIKCV